MPKEHFHHLRGLLDLDDASLRLLRIVSSNDAADICVTHLPCAAIRALEKRALLAHDILMDFEVPRGSAHSEVRIFPRLIESVGSACLLCILISGLTSGEMAGSASRWTLTRPSQKLVGAMKKQSERRGREESRDCLGKMAWLVRVHMQTSLRSVHPKREVTHCITHGF